MELLRPAAGVTEGFAAGARLANGEELDEDIEECIIEALDDVVLPSPANSRRMIVPMEGL